MNYLEWSQEYYDTAEKISEIINKLKQQRKRISPSNRKEIDAKLSQYRACYGECIQTADLLKNRHREVA